MANRHRESLINFLNGTKPSIWKRWTQFLVDRLFPKSRCQTTARKLKRESRDEFTKHQVTTLESIIDTGHMDCVSLTIHQLGVVQVTDDSQTWNMYYCQVSSSTILVIDGLMIDEDFCAGSMPCSKLDFYSYRLLNGKRTILSIMGSGERLKPLFFWEPYQAKWPYMPKPPVFAGRLEEIAGDMNHLPTVAAPDSEFAQLEGLLERL